MQVRGAPLIGATAAYGVCLALRADASDEALERACATAHRHPPDRHQSQMGARRDGGGGAQPPARGAARRRLSPCGRDQRRGRRHQQGDRPPRRGADRGDRGKQAAGRAGPRAHPLQRRLSRHRRSRDRDRADLHRARPGRGAPCLGRRDPPAQPGRLAHRLGARPARRAAHRDPRQYRRPPDAARHGRHGDRRHRPGDRERRRLQQDRHLSQGARRQGQRRAVLRGAAVADHRLFGVGRRLPRYRSSSAPPTRSRP